MKILNWFKEASLYLLLLAISVAFSLPLLWMMITSVKVDREFLDTDKLLPAIPHPADVSPYLTQDRVTEDLREVSVERWEREIRELFGEAAPDAVVEAVAREVAKKEGAEGIVLPGQVEFLVDRAWRASVRELLVGKPVLRSRERETFAYETGGWLADAGVVAVEDAYRPEEGGKLIAYEFAEGREAFDLKFSLEMSPEEVERIEEIVLPIHADNSWHRAYVTLRTSEGVWQSKSPFYLVLGSGGWSELTWRKPDFKRSGLGYEFFKAMPQANDGEALLEPGQVSIILQVERSGLAAAIWGKVLRNYEMVFAAMPFGRYLLNSLIIVVLNIVAAIISCSLAGYAFARLRWRGRQVYFIIMLATMTIPPQVTMVPTFIIMKHLGFYNTYMPLVLPSMIATPFFVFLLRQFLKNVPRDLEDAAVMDGCSHFRIYWSIMLPLIRPTLVIVALFTFIGSWNDFLGPLIYLSDQNLYPVSLGIFAFQSYAAGVGLGSPAVMMAASTLMVLPVIAVFFFAQRYFTQGIKMTGLK